MFPTEVVIVAGARTPMSRYAGAFSDVSAIDLAAAAAKEAIRRSNADPAEFDHAIFGNVMQTSADALYGARHVALKAGLPAMRLRNRVDFTSGTTFAARRSGTDSCWRHGEYDSSAFCDSRIA